MTRCWAYYGKSDHSSMLLQVDINLSKSQLHTSTYRSDSNGNDERPRRVAIYVSDPLVMHAQLSVMTENPEENSITPLILGLTVVGHGLSVISVDSCPLETQSIDVD